MPLIVAFLASAAAAAPPAPAQQPAVRVAVQVSARIVSGARVELGRSANAPGHLVRSSVVTTEGGAKRPARLVEFE